MVPELAGWRRERMPDYPDAAYFTLAPDWVCEVLSPSTRKLDLHGKRPIYAREGVAHLWLVEPAGRTLEAFELHEGQWVLTGDRQGRRPGVHPSLRCRHLQPRRHLALTGGRTWHVGGLARPAGLEPATLGLEGRSPAKQPSCFQ